MSISRIVRRASRSCRAIRRNQASPHPEDEDLEQYSLRSATSQATIEIEEHLLVCEHCRERLTRIERLLGDCRALWKAIESGPRNCVHATPSGAVQLSVFLNAEGRWVASLAGQLLPGSYTSYLEANLQADLAFARFFPDHACGADCGPVRRGSS